MRLFTTAATICFALVALMGYAQAAPTDYRPYGSNFYAYPYPENPLPELTPSPEGYTPFHMEHYGRHGSRWHIGKSIYKAPVEILEVAERNNRLTPRGRTLIEQLRANERASRGRDGELTPKGARQHQGIARRMLSNFPELFIDSIAISARSTPVVRCILSMDNELRTFAAANPTFRIDADASRADIDILNFEDSITRAYSDSAYKHFIAYEKTHPFRYDFLKRIIVDADRDSFVTDSIDKSTLLWTLFLMASNTQSHDNQDDLFDIFSPEEIREKWEHTNLDWYLRSGNSVYNDHQPQYGQRNFLRNLIASADTAIASGNKSANLRFGHEVVVLPAVVLMEFDDYARDITDLDSVANQWRNYEIFPMAANIQMVFYRSETDPSAPILVKALLNEKEVALPTGQVEGPYYDWKTLRDYYLHKLRAANY